MPPFSPVKRDYMVLEAGTDIKYIQNSAACHHLSKKIHRPGCEQIHSRSIFFIFNNNDDMTVIFLASSFSSSAKLSCWLLIQATLCIFVLRLSPEGRHACRN